MTQLSQRSMAIARILEILDEFVHADDINAVVDAVMAAIQDIEDELEGDPEEDDDPDGGTPVKLRKVS